MRSPKAVNTNRESVNPSEEEAEEFNPMPQIGLHKDENHKYLMTG